MVHAVAATHDAAGFAHLEAGDADPQLSGLAGDVVGEGALVKDAVTVFVEVIPVIVIPYWLDPTVVMI